MHIFRSYTRRCARCGESIIEDVVEFRHKLGCSNYHVLPEREFGWFWWIGIGTDVHGPFETQTLAIIDSQHALTA